MFWPAGRRARWGGMISPGWGSGGKRAVVRAGSRGLWRGRARATGRSADGRGLGVRARALAQPPAAAQQRRLRAAPPGLDRDHPEALRRARELAEPQTAADADSW